MKVRLFTYTMITFVFIVICLFVAVAVRNGLDYHALEADYDSFLLGGKMAAQGHGDASALYDMSLQQQTQQAMLAGTNISFPQGLLPFLNPPFVALLLLPLSQLPNDLGFLLWDGLQLAALLLALWLLGPLLAAKSRYLLWLGAFAFLPTDQTLYVAQLSALILLGITLLWRGLKAGGSGEWWGGAGLGLCLVKPQILPLFLLYLVYKRNWRALGSFAAASLVLYLLAAVISGWSWPLAYANALIVSQRDGYGFNPATMRNLLALLHQFGLDYAPLVVALSLLVVAALVYVWWRSDTASPYFSVQGDDNQESVGALELQLAATTIAALLISPHLYVHDLTILLFSGAVLFGWVTEHRYPTWLTALLLGGLFVPVVTYLSGLNALTIGIMIVTFAALLYLLYPRRSLKEVWS